MVSISTYWRNVFGRAWGDADLLRATTAIKTLGIALLPSLYLLSRSGANAALVEMILLTLAAYVFLSLVFFLGYLVIVPAKMDAEIRHELQVEVARRVATDLPVLHLEITRVASIDSGPPPLKAAVYLHVVVRNDGGPTTLREWSLTATVQGVRHDGLHIPFWTDRVIPIAGVQPVVIPAAEGMHGKTGNTPVQSEGEITGFLEFIFPELVERDLAYPDTALTLTVKGRSGATAAATYALGAVARFPATKNE